MNSTELGERVKVAEEDLELLKRYRNEGWTTVWNTVF
jgi:hypothetical protein